MRIQILKHPGKRGPRSFAKGHPGATRSGYRAITGLIVLSVRGVRLAGGMPPWWFLGLLLGPVISTSALAAEWAIEPAVALRTEYNDNLRLTLAPHDSVTLSALSPQVLLRKTTETSEISLRGIVNLNRYWDDSSLNSTDYIYNLNASLLNERSQLSLNAGYVRDSTLASELTETGVLTARTQRSSIRVNPQWSWSVSPLSAVGLSYSFADVSYAARQSAGLTDYRNQDVSIWGSHKLGERDELKLGAYYAQYETRPAAYQSDTYGITLGYARDFSENTKVSTQLGVRRTKATRQALTQVLVPTFIPGLFQIVLVPQQIDSQNGGALLNIGIDTKWSARTTLRGRISRELNPSGSGSLVESDRISAGVSHGFTERTNLNVNASAYRTRFSDAALSASNSRYHSLEARLDSRLDEHWSVSAGYRYARQKYESADAAADANVIFVSARYDWTKIAVSR